VTRVLDRLSQAFAPPQLTAEPTTSSGGGGYHRHVQDRCPRRPRNSPKIPHRSGTTRCNKRIQGQLCHACVWQKKLNGEIYICAWIWPQVRLHQPRAADFLAKPAQPSTLDFPWTARAVHGSLQVDPGDSVVPVRIMQHRSTDSKGGIPALPLPPAVAFPPFRVSRFSSARARASSNACYSYYFRSYRFSASFLLSILFPFMHRTGSGRSSYRLSLACNSVLMHISLAVSLTRTSRASYQRVRRFHPSIRPLDNVLPVDHLIGIHGSYSSDPFRSRTSSVSSLHRPVP
jgi:hypothetical protein